tara:strand:- start:582 stop:1643 length:1062 start_codon:yes stop_codon:yes gene_type:complete
MEVIQPKDEPNKPIDRADDYEMDLENDFGQALNYEPDIITPESVQKELSDNQTHSDLKDQYRFAILSKGAYDVYYYGKVDAETEVQKYLPLHNIVQDLTDKKSVVFEKTKKDGTKEIIISYRGTAWKGLDFDSLKSSAQDVYADLTEVFTGVKGNRFNQAERKYLAVKQEFPNAKIITTGHSLGSSQALNVARTHDLPSYIFNVGSSPLDFVEEQITPLFSGNKHNIIKSYSVAGDLISTSNKLLDRTDRVINVNPRDITTDVARVALATYINPFLGGATALATSVLKYHDLANFLPDRVFKRNTISEYLIEKKPEIPMNTSKNLAKFNTYNPDIFRPIRMCPPNDPICRKFS